MERLNLESGGASPRRHRPLRRSLAAALATTAVVAVTATAAQAASVPLGGADGFAVLAGTTVTNTGPSVINGSLGLSPGSAVSGFPPGVVLGGTMHVTDGVALQAKQDLTTAYNDAAGRSTSATITADLAGVTLAPGTYTSASSMGLSGDLTLDAHGDAGAVFVFQAGSSLTVGSGSKVLLLGGAQACNVFWQVGSSATIGSGSAFAGSILALTSISLTTGASLQGRALARNGAVTLDTNRITTSRCTSTTTTPGTGGTSGTGGTGGTGGTSGGGTTGDDDASATGSPGSGSTATPGSPAAKKAALAKVQRASRLLKARKAAELKRRRAASLLRRQRELQRRRGSDLPPGVGGPGLPPRTPGRFTG